MLKLSSKDDQVESGDSVERPRVRVDCVQIPWNLRLKVMESPCWTIVIFLNIVEALQRISGAGHVAKLPIDVSLNAGDVEEHVHPGKHFLLCPWSIFTWPDMLPWSGESILGCSQC